MLIRAAQFICYLLALLLTVSVSMYAVSGVAQVIFFGAVIVILLVAAAIMGDGLRYQWPTILLVVLSVTGLALVAYMATIAMDTTRDVGFVERVCSPEGGVNHCQQAFQSHWATLPLGFGAKAGRISTFTAGVAFYSMLLVWFVAMGRPRRSERWWHLIPVAITSGGLCIAGFLTIIMYTQFEAACPLCMASHVCTALLFVVTLLVWPRERSATPVTETAAYDPVSPDAKTARNLFAPLSWQRPVAGLVLAMTVGILGMQTGGSISLNGQYGQLAQAYKLIADDPAFMRWDLSRQPEVPWEVRPDDSVRGSESAPFVVITYSDFQCPQCNAFAKKIEAIQTAFPGRLRVIFRHFPLDRACNAKTKTVMHAFSCQAARAAEAAWLLGGNEAFWKMHDALYANRDRLYARPYAELAVRIGLDVNRFNALMRDPKTDERIKAHVESSEHFKVASTPGVYLNGRRVRTWGSIAFWRAILEGPAGQPTSTKFTSGPTTTRAASR
ncbi:MAG: thioredoxin domain-containing protein [Phycisphaerae bacterium]|nr:thioredoxin domain-containing protein [Phycisphaerae bacterium]